MIGRKLWLSLALLTLISSTCILTICGEDAVDGEIIEEGDTELEEEKSSAESVQMNEKKTSSGESEPSSDAQVTILFTSTGNTRELVAGRIVKFLIGFANRGEKDFIVKASDTSFRYPMDFNYHVQNFSAVQYNQVVQPKQEATFDYSFIPSDAFIGRPLGLVVNLYYTDADGMAYTSAVFNETVNIVEDESGFNTETGMLYITLSGLTLVILFFVYNYLSKFTKKPATSYQPALEVGTNSGDVDYEWIPRTNLIEKKSPKARRPAKTN